MEIKEIRVDKDLIRIDNERILQVLGYSDGPVPEPVQDALLLSREKAIELCEFKCGFRSIEDGTITISKDTLQCQGLTFATGRIIGAYLKRCTGLAFFVATIGPRFEQWSRECLSGGDPVLGFVSDAMASEMTELTADYVEAQIAAHVSEAKFAITNRYSPGYCGWPLIEQQKLFSLFPPQFCGITLTESSLMLPIKSVSGVIGFGSRVVKQPYTCDTCDMVHCIYRRRVEKKRSYTTKSRPFSPKSA
jgi:hypothetical protein